MKKLLILLAIVCATAAQAAEKEISVTVNGTELYGTLLVPDNFKSGKVALLIAGSGPTDRDGNNPMMKNNSLKMIAQALEKAGIASLRYDKRGIGKSVSQALLDERELRFDHFIQDAGAWVDQLAADPKFSEITVIGHSEGSLIGMVVAKENKHVAKYVSVAGVGRNTPTVLKEQLADQPAVVKDKAYEIIDLLSAGKTTDDVPSYLNTLFRPSIQPYMVSWFAYDPQAIIKEIRKPILIIQGDKDIQIGTADAQALKAAAPQAQLLIVQNMNHVLKTIDTTDKTAQMPTYTSPDIPLSEPFVKGLISFLQ